MSINNMWSQNTELLFFKSCENFASPEQLFYITNENKYFAYWQKDYYGKKSTLQSRNSLIGKFSEKWTANLIKNLIKDMGLFAIQSGAQCDEIGLTNKSPADIVISTKNKRKLKPKDIKIIFEVKMSLVWNWELNKNVLISEIGDYKTHQGRPGLLRSDSILKAIGNVLTSEFLIFSQQKFR